MALASSSSNPTRAASIRGQTEFEILKNAHKFLRDEEEKGLSWDEQLASKYYASLYREFAICDLKHFKTGNFALRWRTEEEVISAAGESTCANTRCKHHHNERVALTTLELPFAYEEHGEAKSAMVKVVLCSGCVKKLMWKKRHSDTLVKEEEVEVDLGRTRKGRREGGYEEERRRRRGRSSRSRSPRRRSREGGRAAD